MLHVLAIAHIHGRPWETNIVLWSCEKPGQRGISAHFGFELLRLLPHVHVPKGGNPDGCHSHSCRSGCRVRGQGVQSVFDTVTS